MKIVIIFLSMFFLVTFPVKADQIPILYGKVISSSKVTRGTGEDRHEIYTLRLRLVRGGVRFITCKLDARQDSDLVTNVKAILKGKRYGYFAIQKTGMGYTIYSATPANRPSGPKYPPINKYSPIQRGVGKSINMGNSDIQIN